MLDLMLFGVLTLMLGTDSLGSSSQAAPSLRPPVVVSGDLSLHCELAALLPHAPLTVDECKALLELNQIVAAVNPDAARAGDNQMTCAQIRVELLQMGGLRGSQESRFDHSIVRIAQDLSDSIRENPRLGRLVQLAAARRCKAQRRR